MEALYKFHWDRGRMGDVESIFVADTEEVAKAIGKTVYFGEILGKFSDIEGTLSSEDLIVLTEDQDFIAKYKLYNIGTTGHNPLDYIS